ncbi:MAG: phage tail-type lysozyme domain-containing protein [Candidatus Nomurabacteria bacterium]|nr:phage tail-type lysozyme domain-containing protein [Candidatus Nomurabacteria bacterium]
MNRIKPNMYIKYSFLVILSALLVVVPGFGLSGSYEDKFAQNDIIFYNPEGSDNDRCYGGFSKVCGDTALEKIYSGLVYAGFTPEQAAGSLGNIAHEANMNPAQWEIPYDPNFDYYNNTTDRVNGSGGGVGLIQWSFGRRVAVLNYVKTNAPNLMKYFEEYQVYSDGYKINGDKFIELAGEQDANALYTLEIQYLNEEMRNNDDYKKVFDQDTVENATWMFLTQVERPAGITKNSTLEQAKSVKPERFQSAEEYYSELKDFSCGGGGGSAVASTDGSDVTIIGDSITEGSKSNLLELMPKADISSEVGRQFVAGIGVAESMDLRKVVVFALGTDSVALTEDQIGQALSAIGGDKTIVLVTNYSGPGSDLDYSNNNELLRKAADNNANVRIADWATSAGENPGEYIASDGIRPTAAGQRLFADLIYNVITGLGNLGDGCGVGGAFAQLVLAYAWPEYHASPYFAMMPDYELVVAKRQDEGRYVGGGSHPGIDCGGWVTTLMQESGYEPNYNDVSGGTAVQEQWVKDHGWTRLNPSGDIDTSLLRAGDVALTDGHTFVFVGEISGFDSNIASASYGGENPNSGAWRAPMAGTESLTGGVRWYRKGA